ncbi:MAG: hypothetical protein NW216_08850 [Hyphomicrobium sp.]|nr:hypothetical protein [Hyphomicrobium sp.]
MNAPDGLDLGPVLGLFQTYRLFIEVGLLVLLSTLAGFVIARWLYRGQVGKRSNVLREELAKSRRRLSLETAAVVDARRDRDRWSRMYRKTRRAEA